MKPNENPSANNKQDSTLVSPIHRPLVSDENLYHENWLLNIPMDIHVDQQRVFYDSPFKNQYEKLVQNQFLFTINSISTNFRSNSLHFLLNFHAQWKPPFVYLVQK